MGSFDDVLAANADYAASFAYADVPGPAARGLGIVTCMDSRIDPLAVFGLKVGDAKIIRNAGGQVTDEVLTQLVIASHLLNVSRILIAEHTSCKMASATDEQVHEIIRKSSGIDTRSVDWGTIPDQHAKLAHDVQKVRSSPLLKPGTTVGGFLYDLATGALTEVV